MTLSYILWIKIFFKLCANVSTQSNVQYTYLQMKIKFQIGLNF